MSSFTISSYFQVFIAALTGSSLPPSLPPSAPAVSSPCRDPPLAPRAFAFGTGARVETRKGRYRQDSRLRRAAALS